MLVCVLLGCIAYLRLSSDEERLLIKRNNNRTGENRGNGESPNVSNCSVSSWQEAGEEAATPIQSLALRIEGAFLLHHSAKKLELSSNCSITACFYRRVPHGPILAFCRLPMDIGYWPEKTL